MTIRTSNDSSRFSSHFQDESANTAFGVRLKALREDSGLTQAELASKMGVGKNTIQRYESGDYPKGDYLLKLAKMFNCSIDWLLTGVDKYECEKRDMMCVAEQSNEYQPHGMRVKVTREEFSNIQRALTGPEQKNNLVVLEHMDIVKRFQDSELAKAANMDLIDIEKINPAAFREVTAYIKGVASGLKYAESLKKSGADRRHDQRRTQEDPDKVPNEGDRRQVKNRRTANGT